MNLEAEIWKGVARSLAQMYFEDVIASKDMEKWISDTLRLEIENVCLEDLVMI